MQITVKSRYFFENIKGTEEEAKLFSRYRVISVNSVRIPEEPPFSEQYWRAANVLILHFDDLDDPFEAFRQSGRFMSEADAEAIASFIDTPDQRPIVVHCTAGISRSGAIGACLNEYYNKKLFHDEAAHQAFWTNHPYIKPNLHVMKLLWKRLKLEI
jgi:predicted protein tyrosine phosphatase